MPKEVEKRYTEILENYVNNQSEQDLYAGQKFSREFIEKEISPEEVIGIHKAALQELCADAPEELWHTFDFLIEMMIHYGLALQEHQSLIRKQEEMDMEMKIASQVQNTLLKTKAPEFSGLDIGFLTVPAQRMSGDYIYFGSESKEYASVAVADVIGKGVPAALCMSMIKFGMDNMEKEQSNPTAVLAAVNKIVEDSVTDSMFISMFYGKYDPLTSVFSYASAGHEPAMLFKKSTESFQELDAKGLLLGVQSSVHYEERSVVLEAGDFVVMMTDGVTESRTETGFIEEDYLQEIFKSVHRDCAQAIADAVYLHLAELQNFQLRDDFTLVVFKKTEVDV